MAFIKQKHIIKHIMKQKKTEVKEKLMPSEKN